VEVEEEAFEEEEDMSSVMEREMSSEEYFCPRRDEKVFSNRTINYHHL